MAHKKIPPDGFISQRSRLTAVITIKITFKSDPITIKPGSDLANINTEITTGKQNEFNTLRAIGTLRCSYGAGKAYSRLCKG